MTTRSRVLWRRVDCPGHEAAELSRHGDGWHLSGTAVFLYGGAPSRLDYRVTCDADWRTTAAQVRGAVGDRDISLDIAVDAQQRWFVNAVECAEVAGCVDIDLSFTPATNLLPVRRLGPPIGVDAALDAAWLEFPTLTLQRLDQVYRRTAEDRYHFASGGGSFTADLVIDGVGWVVHYPEQWQLIGTA